MGCWVCGLPEARGNVGGRGMRRSLQPVPCGAPDGRRVRPRNPFSRAGNLHGFPENFRFHGFLAQQALQLPNLLHGLGQLRGRHHGLACSDRWQAAVLMELAPMEELIRVDAMTASDQRYSLAGLEAFPDHG